MEKFLELLNLLILALVMIALSLPIIYKLVFILFVAVFSIFLPLILIAAFSIFIPLVLIAAVIPAIESVQLSTQQLLFAPPSKQPQPQPFAAPTVVINDKTRNDFLNISANKKKEFQQMPSLSKIKSDIKIAEDLTKQILQKSNNSNLNDRNTLLNILGNLGQQSGKQFLFYDSNKTKINEKKAKELKFTLNLDGFEAEQKVADEVDTVMTMKSCIDNKESHPILQHFKEKLSRVYNVSVHQIKIMDIFCGSINVTYVVDVPKDKLETYYAENISGEKGDIDSRMKAQFKQYNDCKIHAILFRDSFDINMFDEKGNKTFDSGSSYKVGPKGYEQDYIQPAGWVRFGLNILKSCKYGADHSWLTPFQHANNWYRCYHGTGNSNSTNGEVVDVMAWIHDGGFHYANAKGYGPGVYCSPDPKWLESNYAGTHTVNGKKYKFMLQCGVNPNGVRIYQDKLCGDNWSGGSPWGPIWVANAPNEIRPYGILIKEE